MLTGSHYLHLTSCLENEYCAEAPSHSQEHQKQTTSTCLLHPHLFLLRELCPEPRLPLALKFIGLCPYSYSPRTPHVDMPPTAGCLGHPVQHHPWHTASGTWAARQTQLGTWGQTHPLCCQCPGRLASSRGQSQHLRPQRTHLPQSLLALSKKPGGRKQSAIRRKLLVFHFGPKNVKIQVRDF